MNGNHSTAAEERKELPERCNEGSPNASKSDHAHTMGSLYELCLPYILKEMKTPISIKELAPRIGLQPSQLTEWIKKAELEGKVRKHLKPVRYSSVEEVTI